MNPHNFRAFVLIILASVTFSSCEKVEKPQTQRTAKGDVVLGGTLAVALPKGEVTLLPAQIVDASSSEIGLHLHGCLVALDPKTLEAIPSIAESWSADESGTSYIFSIRRDVKFHANECFGNGSRDVTAHDFVYSFKQLCASDSKAFGSTFANRVEGADVFHAGSAPEISGVQAIDDYTLRIELMKPDPSFLFVLAQPSTAVISEIAMEKYGAESKVGAGAFMYGSDADGIALVRNPEYFVQDAFGNRLPYLDTLVFREIAGKEAQLEAFFEGKIDLVSGLYLDPVRSILETKMDSFSGEHPAYIMERESESVGFESYSIYRADLKGFGSNFMGFRDFLRVQIEQ
ncbi:MAG: hypothetical protein GC178_17440 [Flavobacteriales bacterium]|nr:hypothetical protein [Flavobacteriales bacterium]